MFSKMLLVVMNNNSICISIMILDEYHSNTMSEKIFKKLNLFEQNHNWLTVLETYRTGRVEERDFRIG